MIKINLVVLFLWVGTAQSQTNKDFVSLNNFTPPSPEAAALGRYGQIPVNYSTGIPSISVPLYDIKSGKVSLSLSLSYHASGIKVEDIATTAGLGWVLNAGGAISRNVVGRADEVYGIRDPLGWKIKNRSQLESSSYADASGPDNFNYLTNLINGNADPQSDIYDINAPSFTGRFVYDSNKQVQYTPVDKQLNIIWNASDTSYSIIDDDGTTYVFGEKERTEAHSTNDITSWLLTLIISADKADTIYLKYKSGANFYDSFNSQHYSLTIDPDFAHPESEVGYCPPRLLHDHFDVQTASYTYQRKLIDSIRFSNGYAKFNYLSDRQDPGTERLVSLQIGTEEGVIKKIELIHSYFESSDNTSSTIPSRAKKRLKLDRVNMEDSSSAIFGSYGFDYNTQVNLPCYFQAYYGNFPAIKSTAYDLWGYYNGGNSGYILPSHFRNYLIQFMNASQYGIDNGLLYNYDIKSSDRYPNPDYTQACILKKITFPTGGFTSFEFENNKVKNNGDNHDYTGGLRISKIISGDYRSAPLVKTYAYGDSSRTGTSISRIVPEDFYYSSPTVNRNPNYTNTLHFCNAANFYVNTNPSTAINYYGGAPAIYTKVTEYNGYPGDNLGKTEYEFENDIDSVYNSSDTYKYWNFSTDKSWTRGLPLATKIYKNQNGAYALQKKIINTYSSMGEKRIMVGVLCEQRILTNYQTLENYLSYLATFNGGTHLLDFFEYVNVVLVQGVKKLVKTEETDYAGDSLTHKREFFYESTNHLYPTKVKSYSSDGSINYDITKYPQDKSLIQNLSTASSAALDSMTARNIKSLPVESETLKGTNLLYRNRIDYVNWNSSNRFYQQYRSQQVQTGALEQRLIYSSYDDKGNVTALSKTNDVSVAYLWDYKKAYPVAQATNAGADEIAYESFEAEGTGGWTIGNTSRVTSTAFTGKKSFDVASGGLAKYRLSTGKTFIVTYWSANGASKSVNGTSGVAKAVHGSWTLFEHVVSTTSTYIILSGSGVVDDVCLYPQSAQMTTYTYRPLVGITSVGKPNGDINFYEYDSFGRLLRIKNMDNKILKQFQYQVLDGYNALADWQPTSNYRSIPGVSGYSKGEEREQKDMNPSSPSYNQTRWVTLPVGYTAAWVNVTGLTRCKPGVSTGEQQQGQRDQNPYSSTYGQIAWVTTGITCACTPSAGCGTVPGTKIVNGCCETGIKIYDSYYYDSSLDRCYTTYHYEWSDASWSNTYYEDFSGVCPSGN